MYYFLPPSPSIKDEKIRKERSNCVLYYYRKFYTFFLIWTLHYILSISFKVFSTASTLSQSLAFELDFDTPLELPNQLTKAIKLPLYPVSDSAICISHSIGSTSSTVVLKNLKGC